MAQSHFTQLVPSVFSHEFFAINPLLPQSQLNSSQSSLLAIRPFRHVSYASLIIELVISTKSAPLADTDD